MYKNNLISIVASSALLGALVLTGCGGSSSDSSSSANGEDEIISMGSTTVKVSDAYVLNATVTAGSKVFNIHNDDGEYEIAEDNVTGPLSAIGGINDLNANNLIDQGEPFAPMLLAPSGYKNITPFTTMIVNNVNIASEPDYQAVAGFAPNYDFDVVAEGATFENGIAQSTAIAALRLSAGGNGSGEVLQSNAGDDTLPGTGYDDLPGTGDVASSSSVVASSSSSTSSTASVVSGGGGILPSAISLRGILPGNDDEATPASSSSSEQSSSSLASSSSVSSAESSSVSSSATVSSALEDAINKIRNAKSHEELNAFIKTYMSGYNGSYFPTNSSSADAQSSSQDQSGETSSSSVINTDDDCLPGFDCSVEVSSSSESSLSSSISSSVSSVSTEISDKEADCEALGSDYTWNAGASLCMYTPAITSSSSSTAPAPGGGSVLPE